MRIGQDDIEKRLLRAVALDLSQKSLPLQKTLTCILFHYGVIYEMALDPFLREAVLGA